MKHWVWSNEKYLKAWIYCLFRANHSENKILIGSAIIKLEPGEFITSRSHFSKDVEMTEQSVRTFWKLLEADQMISIKSTSTSTKISICNYAGYQHHQQTINQPVTSDQPASNQPVTTDKNVKKEKELKEFKEEAHTYKEKYSSEMVKEFIEYWTEENPSKTKFRFQLEKTWGMARRLATWNKRDKQYKPESKNLYPGYKDSSFD